MTRSIDPIEMTLAELATRHPAASRVFRRERLDYCCGGRRPLAEVCRERGLDVTKLLHEITEAPPPCDSVDWSARPLPALVDHIVARYHESLRREFPALLEMARKVEAVHADKPTVPKGLHGHLMTMHADVVDHLDKEERVLFPLVREGRGRDAAAPVRAMECEHKDHGENLARTRQLTDDYTPPAEACTTWRALYLRLEALESELMEHIHLENNILFPRALCE
jgi:regulator of cell morphogenesis and NO signaling